MNVSYCFGLLFMGLKNRSYVGAKGIACVALS